VENEKFVVDAEQVDLGHICGN